MSRKKNPQHTRMGSKWLSFLLLKNVIAVAFLDLSSLCVISDPFYNFLSDSGIHIKNLVCWITKLVRFNIVSIAEYTYEGTSANMNVVKNQMMMKKIPTSHFPSQTVDRLNQICIAFLSPWSHFHRHTLRCLKIKTDLVGLT